jgi:hypothetical protein
VTEPHPDLQPPDERTALAQRLDHHRWQVATGIDALDDAEARRRALPATDLTIIGIVKHLAWAEDLWFHRRLLGHDVPEPWVSVPTEDQMAWPFRSAVQDTVDDVATLYRAACDRSRQATADADLDTAAVHTSFGKGPVNLRWILVHMTGETARHLGHIDLLRDALAADPPSR